MNFTVTYECVLFLSLYEVLFYPQTFHMAQALITFSLFDVSEKFAPRLCWPFLFPLNIMTHAHVNK